LNNRADDRAWSLLEKIPSERERRISEDYWEKRVRSSAIANSAPVMRQKRIAL
jgi:hypothetical protein